MFWKLLFAALAVGAVFWLLWYARGALLTPVRLGKNTRLTLTIEVSGPEPRLEETLDAVMWLRLNGTLPCAVTLTDAGMDEETRELAVIAARDCGVTLGD